MWKIFQNNDLNLMSSFQSINDWKLYVFDKMDVKLKEYFAKKVVVYFDNNMIFNQKRGMHENLLDSLSFAEKEMQQVYDLFPSIRAFWLPEDAGSFLITLNLPQEEDLFPTKKYGFKLIKDDAVPATGQLEKLQHTSWGTLVFSPELSDFARGWIDYTPGLEERTVLQAKYIILQNHFKNGEFSLLEKIEFEEKIEEHHQFKELYEKIYKVMPKIESSLEDEWRTSIVNGMNPTIKINKKAMGK